jgi:hypothetical protein
VLPLWTTRRFQQDSIVKGIEQQQGNAQKLLSSTRVYVLTRGEAEIGTNMVTSKILILGYKVTISFGFGATHSFNVKYLHSIVYSDNRTPRCWVGSGHTNRENSIL